MDQKKNKKEKLNIIGVMNGTSMDAVDWVLCEVALDPKNKKQPIAISYIDQSTTSFPPKLKEQLQKAAQHQSSLPELIKADNELGQYYAKSLKRVLSRKKWKFHAIGLHGQTVYHCAEKTSSLKTRGTLQIGDPSYLKQSFNVPVIHDFRSADMAAGGQGAPLAPFFHKTVFAPLFKDQKITVHNLGGISNVTYLDVNRQGQVTQILGFDTGPANMPMDLAIQKLTKGDKLFDRNGHWAKQGQVCEKSLKKLLGHRFFSKKPPKSCGREEFGENFLKKSFQLMRGKKPFAQLATLTNLTAKSIEQAYRQHLPELPQTMILCGGGAKNKFFVEILKESLPEVSIQTSEDHGWPLSAVEGGAFALLAAMRLWEIKVDTPAVTGAKHPALLGHIG